MYSTAQLKNIMPHKNHMMLIDRVITYDLDKKTLVAEVDINSKSMFFNKDLGEVPIWVGMEYMAQSIAALSSIYDYSHNKPTATMGFIIGARKYKCYMLGFKAGQTISISVEQLFLDNEIGSFDCKIFSSTDEVLASTELNVFRPADITKFQF